MKFLIIILTLFSISWCEGDPSIEKLFLKFGQYEFTNEKGHSVVKSYYSSRTLSLNWVESFLMCRSFDMDLVELPTKAEHDHLLALCQKNKFQLIGDFYHVGGSNAGVGINDFYWITTGQRLSYEIKYPLKPNDGQENEKQFLFHDVDTSKNHTFICQRVTKANCELVDPNESKLPYCNPTTIEWLPHPTSCNKFVLCFHGNPIQKTCASNLRFSGEQGKCISSQLPCCPQKDDVMNPVFLANFNDCSKYYVCFSGKAIERSCAKGLFFDVKSNSCTFLENLTCGSRPNLATEVVKVDTRICAWVGNLTRLSGSHIKSLCYYKVAATHKAASDICHKHGMRLMRIEHDFTINSIQPATFAYLSNIFAQTRGGVYHISGTNFNGSWYHDENTLVGDNLQWKNGIRPTSGCLALFDNNPPYIDAFDSSKNLHAICEYNY